MRYEAAFLSAGRAGAGPRGSPADPGRGGPPVPRGAGAAAAARRRRARWTQSTGIVRIPRALVEAALARRPASFVLGARNPGLRLRLPSPVTRYAMDGTAAFMRDFETGERRYGTRADIERAMRVFQASRHGRAWPGRRSPRRTGPWRRGRSTSSRRCSRPRSKHGQHELHHAGAGAVPGRDPRRHRRRGGGARGSGTRRRSSTAPSRPWSTTGGCWTRTWTSATSTSP